MSDGYRSSAGKSEAFGGALLDPRDLEDAKGIDQRKVVAGAHVRVCPPERDLDTAYPHLGASERVQQRAIDVRNQVAEVIDGHDSAGDLSHALRRRLEPAGDELGDALTERVWRDPTRGELCGHGREDVATMKCRARPRDAERG